MPRPGRRTPAARDVPRAVPVLGAFAFFLSAIEYTFPKPLPFMRLGIANLPILLAVDLLPLPSYLLLAFVKFAGMGLVSGTLLSYVAVFSLAGSLSAALAMRATRFLFRDGVSHLGISVAGAMTSSAVQIILARALVFGEAAWAMAPIFLGASLVTGSLLGLFANRFTASSRWYAGIAGGPSPAAEGPSDGNPAPEEEGTAGVGPKPEEGTGPPPFGRRTASRRRLRPLRWDEGLPPEHLAIAGVIVALSIIFQPRPGLKALAVFALGLLLVLSGRRLRPLATIMVIVSIVGANLAIPVGRVLARLGPIVITETALLEGLGKALAFEGLVFASRLALGPGLRFPGLFGKTLGEAFATWRRIMELEPRFRPASFVKDADALLLKLEAEAPSREGSKATTETEEAPPTVGASPMDLVLDKRMLRLREIGLGLACLAALALLAAGRLAIAPSSR
ncbi:MAG TPA: Gx transporter family protein [Rectinemataceae bacterium]|nr:Gx transporter family protein [Rectinemataceae bacterium]